MGALVKRNGVWVNAADIYVRRSGVWTKVTEGYTKINGTWTLGHAAASPPLSPPVLALTVVRDSYTTTAFGATINHVYQYIRVEARYQNSGSWLVYLLPLKAEHCPEEMTTEKERDIKIARLFS